MPHPSLHSHTARPLRRRAPRPARLLARRLTRIADVLGLVASVLAARIPQAPQAPQPPRGRR